MRAIVYDHFGGPEVMRLAEVSDPRPAAGEVLIAVRAASVIPGDCKLRAGHLQHHFPITFPKIPGRDGAGVIVGIGEGVTGFAPGDAVCFVTQHVEQGSHAERIARPAAEVVAMPGNLDFAQAAALMHAGVCAWIALVDTAGLRSGMTVLVHGGAGAIGGMAVQIARPLGATVAATCRAADAEHVRALGADTVVAYDREDFVASVSDIDVVLDLVGGAVHERSCRVLRRGGMLVHLLAEPFEDRSDEYGVSLRQAVIDDDKAILERVVALAAAGAIVPRVGRVLPLAQAAEAHRLIETGANRRGRIVLEIA